MTTALTGIAVLFLAATSLSSLMKFFEWATPHLPTGGGGGAGGLVQAADVGSRAIGAMSRDSGSEQESYMANNGPSSNGSGEDGSPTGADANLQQQHENTPHDSPQGGDENSQGQPPGQSPGQHGDSDDGGGMQQLGTVVGTATGGPAGGAVGGQLGGTADNAHQAANDNFGGQPGGAQQ